MCFVAVEFRSKRMGKCLYFLTWSEFMNNTLFLYLCRLIDLTVLHCLYAFVLQQRRESIRMADRRLAEVPPFPLL